MRVGLVVPGFSADAAIGAFPALRHLARGLAAGDDVRVVAVRYPYRAARYRSTASTSSPSAARIDAVAARSASGVRPCGPCMPSIDGAGSTCCTPSGRPRAVC